MVGRIRIDFLEMHPGSDADDIMIDEIVIIGPSPEE
jgi:hypothetical protein